MKPTIFAVLCTSLLALSSSKSFATNTTTDTSCKNKKYDRLLRMCGGIQTRKEDTALLACMEKMQPRFRELSEDCQDAYISKTINSMEPIIVKFAKRVEFDSDVRILVKESLEEYFRPVNLWLDLLNGYDERAVEPSMQKISTAYTKRINEVFTSNDVVGRKEIYLNSILAIESAFQTSNETVLLALHLINSLFDQMEEQITTIAGIEDYYCQIDNCELTQNHKRFYTFKLANSWLNFDSPRVYELDLMNQRVLDAMNANQAKIFALIDRWFFKNIRSQELFDFQPIQRRFLGIFKTFAHLKTNKLNDSYFSGSNSKEILSGFDVSFQDRVIKRLKEQNSELERDLEKYERLLAEHLALILQKKESDQSILELDKNWSTLTSEYRNIKNDIRGLELSILRKSKTFADYNSMIEDNAEVFAKYFKSEAIATGGDAWNVSAKHAMFTGNMPRNLEKLSFQKLSGTKGQILNVNVSGKYSPTCSLAKSKYFSKVGIPDGVLFGPEGFYIKYTNGHTRVDSVSNGSTDTTHKGTDSNRPSCETFENKDTCNRYVEGKRNTQYNNKSATDTMHMDMSAHFSIGLRLPLTPFYDFPAGSLLAFILPKGETNYKKAKDVVVLSQKNQLIINEDSDVYFIVNDCTNQTPNDHNRLSVSVSETMGIAQGQTMVTQFVKALKKARAESKVVLEAGANINSEVGLLIKKIIAEFAMADAENSFYKIAKLRDIFDFWLHNEGQIILNRAKIKELDRRISILRYKLSTFEKMRKNEKLRNHLNEQRFQNLLANIDSNLIHTKMADVLSFGSGITIPMIRFHYPKVLNRVAKKLPAPNMTVLTDFKSIGQYVSTMTSQVASTFSDEDAISRQKGQYRSMVLYFPRPADAFPGKVFFGSGLADINRSYSLWDAFINKEKDANDTTLSFYEHDFYRLDSAPGFLKCDIENPVVMDSMIGFVFKQDTVEKEHLKLMNDYGIVSGVEFSPLQRFATRSGLKNFRLKDPTIGTSSIAYGFAREDNIRGLVEVMESRGHTKNTGLGLSPISDIKFKNIRSIKEVFENSCDRCSLKNLTGIAMVFKVYFKHTNVDLNWPKACIEPELNPMFKNVYLPREIASLDEVASPMSQE